MHTKSIKNEYNDLTTFLLSNNLVTLKKKLDLTICNCVGPDNYYLNIDDDVFNKKLIKKYDKFLDLRKKFIRGTIFFCEDIIFTKIINFIKNNDYKSFIFNNLYENNTINFDNSPTHFLERLFGIIT